MITGTFALGLLGFFVGLGAGFFTGFFLTGFFFFLMGFLTTFLMGPGILFRILFRTAVSPPSPAPPASPPPLFVPV